VNVLLDPEQLQVSRDALRSGSLLTTDLRCEEVRDPILRSWRRCVSAETSVTQLRPRRVERANTSNLLSRAAAPVLDRLRDDLSDLGVAVILSNRSGRIISRRVADSRQQDRLDDNFVCEDFDYSEQAVGTNGLGTALEEKKAVWVHGAEHYNDALAVFACVGVPILSPRGRAVAGSLSLAAMTTSSNPMMMTLAKFAADQIEQHMRELLYAREAALASAFAQRGRRADGPAMLLTDDSVLSDTTLLPLMTPASHIALWEAVQRQPWADATASFAVELGKASVQVRARRIEDADGPAYLLHFPPDAAKTHNRSAALTAFDRNRSSRGVHIVPAVHDRVMGAARTADVLALNGGPGSGRLDVAKRIAFDTGREALVLDATLLGGTPFHGWLSRAARAIADGSCAIVRHVESLPPAAIPSLESIVSAYSSAAPRRGQLIVTVDRAAAPPAVAAFLDRLAVTVDLPTLCDMRDHLPMLVEEILESFGDSRPLRLSSSALQALLRWPWPGNFRELRTVLLGGAALAEGAVIQTDDLPARLVSSHRSGSLSGIERAERAAIVEALSRSKGNRSHAATELGIGRTTLYRKMRELKVTNSGEWLE
jgi:transcriptional regulator of acetoin/glycerol metabolism